MDGRVYKCMLNGFSFQLFHRRRLFVLIAARLEESLSLVVCFAIPKKQLEREEAEGRLRRRASSFVPRSSNIFGRFMCISFSRRGPRRDETIATWPRSKLLSLSSAQVWCQNLHPAIFFSCVTSIIRGSRVSFVGRLFA